MLLARDRASIPFITFKLKYLWADNGDGGNGRSGSASNEINGKRRKRKSTQCAQSQYAWMPSRVKALMKRQNVTCVTRDNGDADDNVLCSNQRERFFPGFDLKLIWHIHMYYSITHIQTGARAPTPRKPIALYTECAAFASMRHKMKESRVKIVSKINWIKDRRCSGERSTNIAFYMISQRCCPPSQPHLPFARYRLCLCANMSVRSNPWYLLTLPLRVKWKEDGIHHCDVYGFAQPKGDILRTSQVHCACNFFFFFDRILPSSPSERQFSLQQTKFANMNSVDLRLFTSVKFAGGNLKVGASQRIIIYRWNDKYLCGLGQWPRISREDSWNIRYSKGRPERSQRLVFENNLIFGNLPLLFGSSVGACRSGVFMQRRVSLSYASAKVFICIPTCKTGLQFILLFKDSHHSLKEVCAARVGMPHGHFAAQKQSIWNVFYFY